MSYSNISATLTDVQKTAFKTGVQSLKTPLTFLVNLSNDERQKLRKTGSKRIGYVTDVYKAVVANPQAMPQSFNVTEFGKDVILYSDLIELQNYLKPLVEAIDDTLLAVGSEAITVADEVYGHLKVATKKTSNQSLKSTVQKIADQLKQRPAAKTAAK